MSINTVQYDGSKGTAIDLTAVPLDGRIAADSLHEEEVDMFAKGQSDVTAGSATCSGGTDGCSFS
jgi:hypothetical protein